MTVAFSDKSHMAVVDSLMQKQYGNAVMTHGVVIVFSLYV